jgi:hypothetical protein
MFYSYGTNIRMVNLGICFLFLKKYFDRECGEKNNLVRENILSMISEITLIM